jgi:alpha-L-rhamnosidase
MVYNDIFNGITYDARLENPAWSKPGWKEFPKAQLSDGPGGALVPMTLPPITYCETYKPLTQWAIDGKCHLDFGQNMAGVVTLRIPAGLPAGAEIRIRHSEELDEDGRLYTIPLRNAKATDTYIASGREDGTTWFKPCFTYHGFRYVSVEGLGTAIAPADIFAVTMRNNLDKSSFFTCGNPLVNKIHDNALATERANTHGMLTDCPQRNERQGWLNDATVRFEAVPYCFDADSIYRKIVQDILNDQNTEGAIGCTTPFVWGRQPADPVCSSFLILGREAYRHFGDKDLVAKGYEGFRGWTECLLAHSDDGIVNYSYYGDWAGPMYACDSFGGARSGVTPGIFMSTGYSYFNCRTMAEFADILGKEEDAKLYREKAEFVKNALMKKWYDSEKKIFATGSMACQAFMLWLDLFPKGDNITAAANLRDDLVKSNFRFTTGNLCTRYLFEVLTQYGYVDTAWELITRQTYPSFGFMIQQEATTIWERLELFKHGGMNSHSHPMYGAVYHWFYANLAGVTIQSPSKVRIAPEFPKELMSLHAGVDTIKGQLAVRWFRRYNKLTLLVTVPFGMTAEIVFNGTTLTAGSGFHCLSIPEEQDFVIPL